MFASDPSTILRKSTTQYFGQQHLRLLWIQHRDTQVGPQMLEDLEVAVGNDPAGSVHRNGRLCLTKHPVWQ